MMAAIERDRKEKQKPPVGKRGRHSAVRITSETNVSVPTRISQFPDQSLRDSAGKVFCGACMTVVPNLKSSISVHLETQKHKGNLGEPPSASPCAARRAARATPAYLCMPPPPLFKPYQTPRHPFVCIRLRAQSRSTTATAATIP